jgi:hypothetical protein
MNLVNSFANNTRKKQKKPVPSYTGNMITNTYDSYTSYILDSSGTLTLGNDFIGKTIYVFAIAGGGGGGRANSTDGYNGNGGNGGQIVGNSYNITSSGTYSVNIGVRGLIGGSTTGSGGAGGNTSISKTSGFDISFNAVGGVGGRGNIGTSGGSTAANVSQSTGNAVGGTNGAINGGQGKQLFLTDISFSTIYYGGAGGAGVASGTSGAGGKDGGGRGGVAASGIAATNYGSGGGGGGMKADVGTNGSSGFAGALFIFV